MTEEQILNIAMIGFMATKEGFNGECCFDGLEPVPGENNPDEFRSEEREMLRDHLMAHLDAAGVFTPI